jgi:hypothetical protein
VDQDEVDIQQTRKAGMDITNLQLFHVGVETCTKLKDWAEAESVSVNAIVVSLLDEFLRASRRARRCGKNCGWNFACIRDSCRASARSGQGKKYIHDQPRAASHEVAFLV